MSNPLTDRTLFILSLVFLLCIFLVVPAVSAQTTNCWQYSAQSMCEQNGCIWESDEWGSWCEGLSCFIADDTNQTYCETTMNQTYNLSCGWEIYGANLCDPAGGNFFGSGCPDFDGNEQGCYDSFFCVWNPVDNLCDAPEGDFMSGPSPSCAVISDATTCGSISGCSWDGSSCSGNDAGIQCANLNKTMCPDFTLLSSCCSWNGTSCGNTFDQSCYNNLPAPPVGAGYCEDTLSYTNQTLCNQISVSPWYMPCKWDNSSSECHFNSAAFGGFSSFDEIGTEVGCEAQGGVWKNEQWTDPWTNMTKTDSWCEFNFGSGGNCDASCWACEDGALSLSDAQTTCEGSDLGYCSFQVDSNAFNGYGWCNPKQQFMDGGGKSCNDDCAACEFLTAPDTQCAGSSKGCNWVADTGAANGAGFCYGNSEKYCGSDCFSCYTQTDCFTDGDGGNGACSWDNSNHFCKPSGFTGEVCFDGMDNDNDGNVDCADSGCATDKFCGGKELGNFFGDCPSFSQQGNATCISNGCVWIVDDFDAQFGGAGAGFCDFPGAQCWQHDTDSTACDAEEGCSYMTMEGGFCEVNESVFDSCFMQQNSTGCGDQDSCSWITDQFNPSGGRCEPILFEQCHMNMSRQMSESDCEANVSIGGQSTQICGWQSGHCEPVCFTLTNETCSATGGLCEVVEGICEPDSFGGACFASDGNQTNCEGPLNQTCSYFVDTNANNNVSASEPSGWCDPKGDVGFINFMGDQPPVILGNDGGEGDVPDTYDISDVGLRDTFDKIVFGTSLYDNFEESATCNGVPTFTSGIPGSGTDSYNFFWYVDADGDDTNNCAARDNSSMTGFEFSFKYQAVWQNSALQEVKISYQCVNGSWGAVPIPLTSNSQKMCNLIGGGMAGIDKAEMFKFKGLFDKAANMRIYLTVGNDTSNTSNVLDVAGPFYYSPGSFDFEFEDCSNPGGDSDGDGLTASNDPDCFNFMKFGFAPNEAGFQCGDSIDNDADGLTDCSDPGCTYDTFFCGGTLAVDPDDKTTPKVTWLKVDTFPDGAFVMYDTNEPANGTVLFYGTDSSCATLNKTVRDIGITDAFIPEFKLWHDGPIDNFQYNPEALSFSLSNGTTYYMKTRVCDISGNCAVSACKNFTTKSNFVSCNGCKSTFNFPFTPPSGAVATDPMGNLNFKFQMPDGSETDLGANANSGKQLNYTQTKGFNLVINNPNATTASSWSITLVNATVSGKVASGIQNFSGGDDIMFNSTSGGNFVGLGNTKCQELINVFRPKKLYMGIPGNQTELWQCNSALSNCTNKTSGATLLNYNVTLNQTQWEVPAEWGC
ncbi:MAG: hypothetical protein V1729_00360 [Candidatus Woesearchaeota archaeon]